ncbi:MAG: imidazole glycerol phosphate synthase subunit HisH [Kiritimatiellae bacterium]|nr:imidazole glycerol phosphate synthase subunit HisH [Kiritimatiellia bacterium]
MIGVIDYDMGNLGSVLNACRALGLSAQVLDGPEGAAACRALVLPGVGAFGDGLRQLRERGWEPVLREWIAADRPFLGICLGLQVLFESSEESPGVPGLGVLAGEVRRFRLPPELKVPHMGWNRVRVEAPGAELFEGIPDGAHMYFVHSYYACPLDATVVAARTDYGVTFCSAVRRGALFAVQFHPEKSQAHGLRLLRNFAAAAGVGQVGAP